MHRLKQMPKANATRTVQILLYSVDLVALNTGAQPNSSEEKSEEKQKRPSMVTKCSSSEQQLTKDDFNIIKLISNGAYG